MLLLCSVAPQYPNSGLPPPKELLLSVLAFKPQALDLGVNPSTLSDDDFFPLIEARHLDSFKFLGIREFQGSQFGRVFARMPRKSRSLIRRTMPAASP